MWERLGEWVCALVGMYGLVMLIKWAGAKSHVCVHVDGYVCGEEPRCVQLNVVKLLYKLQYYNVERSVHCSKPLQRPGRARLNKG